MTAFPIFVRHADQCGKLRGPNGSDVKQQLLCAKVVSNWVRTEDVRRLEAAEERRGHARGHHVSPASQPPILAEPIHLALRGR
jgi:hypothetical protein